LLGFENGAGRIFVGRFLASVSRGDDVTVEGSRRPSGGHGRSHVIVTWFGLFEAGNFPIYVPLNCLIWLKLSEDSSLPDFCPGSQYQLS
jgi:hypothetical protein